MTRQAIETRTRLLIVLETLVRVVDQDSALDGVHNKRLLDAYHSIVRAANSLEPLPNA